MLETLRSTGRVLWRHWPALLAWLLGGMLVRHLLIELAGFVGGYTATGGLLILPLAVLARLIGFVGMFLVIRDGLRSLQAIAPLPTTTRERRQDFVAALLASVLPFFAVYTAQRELQGDVIEYAQRALEVSTAQILSRVGQPEEPGSNEAVLNLTFNVWTILIIVLAVAGRLAWKRWADRLPRMLALLALYLEVVWVFFSLLLFGQVLDGAVGWIETRAATAWLTDLRAWIADQLVPLDWIVSGVELVFADAGRVIIEPIAWLVVAGVIYGQAVAAERLRLENRLLQRVAARTGRVPEAVRARVAGMTGELTSQLQAIGRTLALLWRSGPLLIASYLLLYAVVKALEPVIGFGLVRLLGPHEGVFWEATSVVMALITVLLVEPLRVSLIAGAYDSALRSVAVDAGSVETVPPDQGAVDQGAMDQGAIENRANEGSVSYGATSNQNGPSASSGTMNGTSISYGPDTP